MNQMSRNDEHSTATRLQEHPWGDVGQIALAVLFLAVWVADSFFLNWTTFINAEAPTGLRATVGIVNLLIALYLGRASHRLIFRQTGERPKLIREGVFGIVRHPMYLAEILFFLSLLMFSLSLAAAAVWLLLIGFLNIIARYEDSKLRNVFGDEFLQYTKDVPMWLPRFRGTLPSG